MSNLIYPLGAVNQLAVEQTDRIIADAFEDGSSSARSFWAANNFKRRFTVSHRPLVFLEYAYLAGFYNARGRSDPFWFRDNVHRGGNASVRFANPLPKNRGPEVYSMQIQLDEVAPIRALPELSEVVTAAGVAPSVWYDANRELYISHAGAVSQEGSVWDAALTDNRPVWQGGTSLNLGNILAQWQHFVFATSEWAKTSANIAGITAAQNACTAFAIAQHGTIASKQVLFGLGAMGSGAALGIAINATNEYEPWLGGAETWTNAKFTNTANNTWRSLAVTWASASNDATLYVNAASIGTDTNTRSLTAGPATLGAAIDGTLKTAGKLAHVFFFPAALTLAQIKAVHNLFGYQYGLATVA